MGCINQKASFAKRPAQNSSEFLTDSEIQPGVFKPLSTTLFNLFRKPNEIQIIRNASSTKKLFFKEQSPNLTVLTTKDIKMLYNFKNILVVGSYQPFIDRLKAEAQPKMIYSISEQQASEFLEQFPTYRAGEPVQQAKLIPIFVLSSKQIKKKGIQKNIFLHSSQNQNKKLYQKLQLGTLLYDFPDKNPHQMAELFHSCQAKNVLFLHSKNRKQDQLLEILSLYASSQYKVDLLSAQIYIRRCLPHTSINTQKFLQPSQPTHKQIPVGPKQQLSTTQRLQQLLKNLQKQQDSKQQKHEGNLSKTSRSYNLLLTLVNNICSNKTNESYRTVRKNNGQIYELLGKYKSGIGLMKEIGFVEKSGNYVNVLEDKYLKILRVDLEMAYKNFIDAKNPV